MSTRYPWFARSGAAADVAAHMHARGLQPSGKHDKPHVLALWDAIGCVHELNGMRNDAAGRIQQYGHERELQIMALHAIRGAEKALDRKVSDSVERLRANSAALRDPYADNLRTQAVMRHARGEPSRLAKPLVDLDEKLTAGQIDEASYRAQRSAVFKAHSSDPQAMEDAYARIDQRRNDIARTRDANAERYRREGIATTWSKYTQKLRMADLQRFEQNLEELETSADRLIDKRTVSLVNWLEAPLLIDTLEDYHPTNLQDGVVFEDVVGQAIFGIGSSTVGAAKLDAWIAEARASVKTNLVWRAIALNHEPAIAEVDTALAAALAHTGTPLTEASATAALANLKNLQRLADTYKKAQSVYNTNTKAVSASGTRAFGVKLSPINARGVDVLAITLGDRVYKALGLARTGDFVAEKIIQFVFSLRAFVDPRDAIGLVIAQARSEGISRSQTLQRVRTARAFMQLAPVQASHHADDLTRAWKAFGNTHADGAANFKDARLAVVVGMIEGFNFAKLAAQSQGDDRSRAMIAASGLTIMAALADVAAAPAKSLFGSDAWTHQRLKLVGGVLGGVASMIGAGVDFADARTATSKDKKWLFWLYLGKGFVGSLGGALTLVATFSYAAPALQRLTGSAAIGAAARVVGTRAASVIAARILIMSAGAWITLGLVGLQLLVWMFVDDALEDWCDESAFGAHKKFTTSDEQMKAFDKAVLEVL